MVLPCPALEALVMGIGYEPSRSRAVRTASAGALRIVCEKQDPPFQVHLFARQRVRVEVLDLAVVRVMRIKGQLRRAPFN